jgi:hypothetical protein
MECVSPMRVVIDERSILAGTRSVGPPMEISEPIRSGQGVREKAETALAPCADAAGTDALTTTAWIAW